MQWTPGAGSVVMLSLVSGLSVNMFYWTAHCFKMITHPKQVQHNERETFQSSTFDYDVWKL